MQSLDDRWPDELEAGDPRLADVMRDDPSVQVYSAPSPLRSAEHQHQEDSDRSVQMLASVMALGLLLALIALACYVGSVL
ncbi:MAG: hypothetical protein KGL35_07760 [Bradyrhizobium sp.]|nr:hypothetical protein [Bradyrhizobium sp.]